MGAAAVPAPVNLQALTWCGTTEANRAYRCAARHTATTGAWVLLPGLFRVGSTQGSIHRGPSDAHDPGDGRDVILGTLVVPEVAGAVLGTRCDGGFYP